MGQFFGDLGGVILGGWRDLGGVILVVRSRLVSFLMA